MNKQVVRYRDTWCVKIICLYIYWRIVYSFITQDRLVNPEIIIKWKNFTGLTI